MGGSRGVANWIEGARSLLSTRIRALLPPRRNFSLGLAYGDGRKRGLILLEVGAYRALVIPHHAAQKPGHGLGNDDFPFRLQSPDHFEAELGESFVVGLANRGGQQY